MGSVFLFLILLGANTLADTRHVEENDAVQSHKLGPGDWIVIEVFGEEDLSMDVMLDDTGVIDYPFLGSLEVDGLTVGELETVLLSGLKGPYLVDPDITVAIKQYRSIYINGEVESPGAYPYQPGMTVEMAIAMAGGFTERAARNKIEVKRSSDVSGEPVKTEISEAIRPGDIVTVQQSFF